jgi:hypothetical protein
MLLVASQAAARSRGSDLAGRVRSLLMSRSRGRQGAAPQLAQRSAGQPYHAPAAPRRRRPTALGLKLRWLKLRSDKCGSQEGSSA